MVLAVNINSRISNVFNCLSFCLFKFWHRFLDSTYCLSWCKRYQSDSWGCLYAARQEVLHQMWHLGTKRHKAFAAADMVSCCECKVIGKDNLQWVYMDFSPTLDLVLEAWLAYFNFISDRRGCPERFSFCLLCVCWSRQNPGETYLRGSSFSNPLPWLQ